MRAIAELATRRVAARGPEELAFFVDEVALALTCSRQAAWSKLHTALDLVEPLPLVEAEVLASAEALTPSKLRVRVATAVAAVDPATPTKSTRMPARRGR